MVKTGEDRPYQRTHPWINFNINLKDLTYKTWLLLGEAESKCQHVAGVPLRPQFAQELYLIYLSKGVHGTASIEGNTLSEEEVRKRVEGDLKLPPSRAYLGQEVDNIVAGANSIIADLRSGRPMELTTERIESFNRQVLNGLELDDGVMPGEIRKHRVGVMRYLAPEPEDCRHLLDRMCTWLNGLDGAGDPALRFPLALLKAILAHLYIAWIHPFGDGNGRTARLIEFQLLVQAGLPVPSAHLLSDFYNKTREAYYRELDRTSREPYQIDRFIHYAVEGFVDELREQLGRIRYEQMRVTWENYVHQTFHADTPAKSRQKALVLDLTDRDPVPTSKIPELTPRLAALYATKGEKTVSRDVNALLRLRLIKKVPGGVVANIDLIRAFLPERSEV